MTRIFTSDSKRLILELEESWQSRAYENCIMDLANGDYSARYDHHKPCPVQSEYVARSVDSKIESVLCFSEDLRVVESLELLEWPRTQKLFNILKIGDGQNVEIYAADTTSILGYPINLDTCIEQSRGIKASKNVSVAEQVAMFLSIITHHKKNCVVKHEFIRSGHTMSKHFHFVLLAVCCFRCVRWNLSLTHEYRRMKKVITAHVKDKFPSMFLVYATLKYNSYTYSMGRKVLQRTTLFCGMQYTDLKDYVSLPGNMEIHFQSTAYVNNLEDDGSSRQKRQGANKDRATVDRSWDPNKVANDNGLSQPTVDQDCYVPTAEWDPKTNFNGDDEPPPHSFNMNCDPTVNSSTATKCTPSNRKRKLSDTCPEIPQLVNIVSNFCETANNRLDH
ncbi:UNVERIFIED_CONTAM: hypothetical protein Scaly_2849700 [Sesamum calycinum]|uniref:DUF8040 domain-containing protein n=1 Tax=Sesamum calycinum TaxID=2727403 RepID=A0AAW2LI36_9LAMI